MTTKEVPKLNHTGRWIAIGLVAGILCGVLFGDYCSVLLPLGQAYVGLLQMTVLPYLVLSLISKMGRLDSQRAGRMGLIAIALLLLLWLIGVVLVVACSAMLPPIEGASFFNPSLNQPPPAEAGFLSIVIPANIFRSLSDGVVPAVVLFCLFFGVALMHQPGKENVLNFLDLCTACIGSINVFLVKLAPIGLFLLTAAAAGTIHINQLARLQGYLIILTIASLIAAFGALPLLVSGLTSIRYRDLMAAAREPILLAVATGKLLVALPLIVEKCEQLIDCEQERSGQTNASTASIMVPLAYSFPHVGKILTFTFVTFAAWYTGKSLSTGQTAEMAFSATVSSFASPLISIPYFLDRYQLSQDLMALFMLPGFLTMRLGDLVGVVHLMTLTLIVHRSLQGRLQLNWRRLSVGSASLLTCLAVVGLASRAYLASTVVKYDLDQKLLSLEVLTPHGAVVAYQSRTEAPARPLSTNSTLERVKSSNAIRVGYHPDHLPYCYFNKNEHLVGMDVELFHHLATRLDARLEFIPYDYDTLAEQLESGEIDVAIGGLMINPERSLKVGYTHPYQTATIGVVIADHQRSQITDWDDPHFATDAKLAVVDEDLAAAARRELPNVEIVQIESINAFFTDGNHDFDGLLISAEEGAAWNILYPGYAVVVPEPVLRRPVGLAVRSADDEWVRFLENWLEFERLDGSLDRLRKYWVEGDGTQENKRRWCVLRDVLNWLP